MSKKTVLVAIIIPGILFGTIIWAVVMGSDNYLTASGHEGMRSTLFLLMMLLAVPLLLAATGAVAEKTRTRNRPYGWRPWIPYLAGFLAMNTAGFLFALESGLNQYVPFLAPGLAPRLGFALGRVIMYMPFVAGLAAFFALFALAGGYCMYRAREE